MKTEQPPVKALPPAFPAGLSLYSLIDSSSHPPFNLWPHA